jgi:hypothetical protein
MSLWAFAPGGAPAGMQMRLFVDQGASRRESPTTVLVPGQWVEVRWAGAPLSNLSAVGVEVRGSGQRYSGNVFIDELAVK